MSRKAVSQRKLSDEVQVKGRSVQPRPTCLRKDGLAAPRNHQVRGELSCMTRFAVFFFLSSFHPFTPPTETTHG